MTRSQVQVLACPPEWNEANEITATPMGLFGRILIMLLGIAIGFTMVWKTQKWLDVFGHIGALEQKLGTIGGTRTFYKLLGIVIAVGSVLYVTGGLQVILVAVFGGLFGSAVPQ